MDDKPQKPAQGSADPEPSPKAPTGDKTPQDRPRSGSAKALRIGLWVVLAVAAVLVVRAIADEDGSPEATTSEAEIVSIDELPERVREIDMPVYWAGPIENQVAISQPGDDRALVQYLPLGAGTEGSHGLLTVGTYRMPNAAANLRRLGRSPGSVVAATPDGAILYFDREKPQNVYLAYPGRDIQVEVVDPKPPRAIKLVTSGQVVPIR